MINQRVPDRLPLWMVFGLALCSCNGANQGSTDLEPEDFPARFDAPEIDGHLQGLSTISFLDVPAGFGIDEPFAYGKVEFSAYEPPGWKVYNPLVFEESEFAPLAAGEEIPLGTPQMPQQPIGYGPSESGMTWRVPMTLHAEATEDDQLRLVIRTGPTVTHPSLEPVGTTPGMIVLSGKFSIGCRAADDIGDPDFNGSPFCRGVLEAMGGDLGVLANGQ